MRVIIAGSRTAALAEDVDRALALLPYLPTEVISGGARGADTLGEQWALQRGIPVVRFPAQWRLPDGTTDRTAGRQRNTRMAIYTGPGGALVALWDGRSPGTRHMIGEARSIGMLVVVYRLDLWSRQWSSN